MRDKGDDRDLVRDGRRGVVGEDPQDVPAGIGDAGDTFALGSVLLK